MLRYSSIVNKFRLGTKWTSISSLISAIITIVIWGILGRNLSGEEVGVYTYLIIIISLIQIIIQIGLCEAIIHFQINNENKLSTIFFTNIGLALIFIIIIFLLSPIIDQYFNPKLTNKFSFLLQIYSISLLTTSIISHFSTLFQKELDFKNVLIIDLIPQVISLVLFIIIFYFSVIKLTTVVLVTIISSVFASIFSYFLGLFKLYKPRISLYNLKMIYPEINYGIYHSGSSFMNLFAGRLDRFFIGYFFGSSLLGAYELAFRIMIKPIQIINPVLTRVTFPILASFKEKPKYINKWYLNNISLISFMLFPIYFLIYFFSDEIIVLFFGKGWDEASSILKILWIQGLFIAIGNPLGIYLLAIGKTKFELFLNIYRVFLFAMLFLFLQDNYNFNQTIVYYIFTYIFLTWPLDFYLRWKGTMMSIKLFLILIFRNALGSLIALLLTFALSSILDDKINYLIKISFEFGLFTVSYFVYSYFFNRKFFISFISPIIYARNFTKN